MSEAGKLKEVEDHIDDFAKSLRAMRPIIDGIAARLKILRTELVRHEKGNKRSEFNSEREVRELLLRCKKPLD